MALSRILEYVPNRPRNILECLLEAFRLVLGRDAERRYVCDLADEDQLDPTGEGPVSAIYVSDT